MQTLEERGYEIKRSKYISIRAPEQERFVRTKTLGEEYTEESLKTRILYREVGAGTKPAQDSKSQLRAAYVAVIGDVRILAEQRKKVPRKRIITTEYSVDNDLDVYRLSAQLSVISKDNIMSIGDLEGRITKLRAEYEKQRQEINNYIEEHNRMVSLLEQAQEYFALSKKGELTAAEQMKLNICRQGVNDSGIMTAADADRLREQTSQLDKKIAAIKERLDDCRQRYEVYKDIRDTYAEILQGDYISKLVEEERHRREQEVKKRKKCCKTFRKG